MNERQQLREVTPSGIAARRRELGLTGENVGLYVGGLYADKRLNFLIEAADRIRARVPDSELVIVGGGPAEAELRALAAGRGWIKLAGPRFGIEKAEIMRLSALFLMPGLVSDCPPTYADAAVWSRRQKNAAPRWPRPRGR